MPGAFLLLAIMVSTMQQALALPAINPAQARLDATLGGLDGPGFAIAVDEASGMLAAGCEHGTMLYWNKDVSMGVRAGANAINSLSGHRGPVLALAWRGPVLASAGPDRQILFWNIGEGKPKLTLEVAAPVRALAISPDAKLLA